MGAGPPAAFSSISGSRGSDGVTSLEGCLVSFSCSVSTYQIRIMIRLLCRYMENIFSDSAPDAARPSRFCPSISDRRRIGLAVSDELGLTAQGLPTLLRTNKRNDLDHLRRMIKQYGVSRVGDGTSSAA